MTDCKIIASLSELGAICGGLSAEGMRVILCHGVFDLLHIGHIKHFQAAKALGDILVVTLTADRFVAKGPGRPAFAQHLRAEAVAALSAVDYVSIVESSAASLALEAIRPYRYVKGSDYKGRVAAPGSKFQGEVELVRSYGGDIAFTEEEQFSSSSLINEFFSPFSSAVKAKLAELRSRISSDEIEALFLALGDLLGQVEVRSLHEGVFRKFFPYMDVVAREDMADPPIIGEFTHFAVTCTTGIASIQLIDKGYPLSHPVEMYPLSTEVVESGILIPMAMLLDRANISNTSLIALFLVVFAREYQTVATLAALRKVVESILK